MRKVVIGEKDRELKEKKVRRPSRGNQEDKDKDATMICTRAILDDDFHNNKT